jgi:formate hydrogenlyase subunit 6/NADH:ubiquinone oxidoreductase subunit I
VANPITEYFGAIYKAFYTTLVGLKITSAHFFHIGTKPITVQYPDVSLLAEPDAESEAAEISHRIFQGYRGFLEVDPDICIACGACERDCPISCIKLEKVRVGKQQVISAINGEIKNRVNAPISIIVDISKCMFCGLCNENCPTGAVRHTRKFEGSTTEISGLIYEFVTPEKRAELEVLAEKAAEEKAATDKAKKEKEAAAKKEESAADKESKDSDA